MNFHVGIIALFALSAASCTAPPCASEDAAEKAANAYKQCIMIEQQGDGGLGCGTRAYSTFCKRK